MRLNRLLTAGALSLVAPLAAFAADGEWPSYGGTSANQKYAPLDQITAENVGDLKVVWEWDSPSNALVAEDRRKMTFAHEATPLMVGGVLYTISSHSIVAAIDAGTGETIWTHDPKSYEAGRPTNLGFIQRGVAYWSDGESARLFCPTGDSRVLALDAKTGAPIVDFADNGAIDLTQGMRRVAQKHVYGINSPPVVSNDVLVVGSIVFDGPSHKEMPPGDVRGYDVRTGEQLWTFETVPQEGDFGNETWGNESWKYTGNTNCWSIMSADPDLGYVYLPIGTPTNDWYGGHRPGDGLFGESIVCLDIKTGERVWHFQHVHHGVWDYDVPAAPVLADITVDGKAIKALAQITKQGFCWVLDRATGEPVWPIEERPVPPDGAPGEKLSPTQPFPTKPAPFEQQGVSEDDLIDFTPELRAKAVEILKQFNYGPLYTPPNTEKPTLYVPGWQGAGNWNGAAFDPATGMFYIPTKKSAITMLLSKPDAARSNFDYVGRAVMRVEGPDGLPLWKPPYSKVAALNLNTGEYAWETATGDGPRNHEALKELNLPPLGDGGKGFPLLTKTVLFVAQESRAKLLYALEKQTGAVIAEIQLPHAPRGAPLTYMDEGKQYVVMAVGGQREPEKLVALALP